MFERLIKKIAQSLDEKGISYMLIGGQALLLYGSPRLTRDIDITLGIDTEGFNHIKEICKKNKLKFLVSHPEEFVKTNMVLPVESKSLKIRVDFIFSYSPYERQAIKRAKRVLIDNYPVRFASCEDLIIHKLFAARAVDEEDVKNILLRNKKIDLLYIKKKLKDFSKIPEQKDILKRFNQLLKEIRK